MPRSAPSLARAGHRRRRPRDHRGSRDQRRRRPGRPRGGARRSPRAHPGGERCGMTAAHSRTDPITTAVIRHGLVAAGDEMMTNVKRAAYSPSIHQIQDVCVGLVDATGRILTCAPGLPMFLADMGEVVRDGLELVGLDAFESGDVYISNDPFSIGTHINNVATYSPVFIDDVIVAFAVVRGHMVDMGGAV